MAKASPSASQLARRHRTLRVLTLCGAISLAQLPLTARAATQAAPQSPEDHRPLPQLDASQGAVHHTSPTRSVSWFRSVPRFGTYGDTSTSGNLGDCAIAAIADILQIQQHHGPFPSQPFITTYEALVKNDGEIPSTSTALPVSRVLQIWSSTGIAGSSEFTTPVGVSRSVVMTALRRAPLYVTLALPSPDPVSVTVFNGISTSPWVAVRPPKGYLSAGPHAAVAAGFDARYIYLVTWGYVVPVSWTFWHLHATGAWQPRS